MDTLRERIASEIAKWWRDGAPVKLLTNAIMREVDTERAAVPATSVDRWEMEAKALKAREARLVEALEKIGYENGPFTNYNLDCTCGWCESVSIARAALAAVKEE